MRDIPSFPVTNQILEKELRLPMEEVVDPKRVWATSSI